MRVCFLEHLPYEVVILLLQHSRKSRRRLFRFIRLLMLFLLLLRLKYQGFHWLAVPEVVPSLILRHPLL